jgi:Kef-type K+ transport system membrane component KefB
MKNVQLSVQFFIQLVVILLFCRAVGIDAARLGQPQVVTEITGVMLGPSLLAGYGRIDSKRFSHGIRCRS